MNRIRTGVDAIPSPKASGRARAAGALAVHALSKQFGTRVALWQVSFEVHAGEVVAVIGPNGAGKTTLLGILAGATPASGGEVTRAPGEVGWVPQQPALYSKLSAAENFRLFARLQRLPDPEAATRRMLEQTALIDRAAEPVSRLSGGNQQRVNIGIGLLGQPAVLLLDEPSAALDPRQRERLWQFISDLAAGGTTVMFSTHDVAEAERYGDRVLVLADGELLFDGTPTELDRTVPGDSPDFETAFVRFLHDQGH
jgi:ABC-2 type transport system ATP-binding protein